jgi:hypothetical protein
MRGLSLSHLLHVTAILFKQHTQISLSSVMPLSVGIDIIAKNFQKLLKLLVYARITFYVRISTEMF